MFSSVQSYSGLLILDYIGSKVPVLQTCWMVFAPLRLESYLTDEHMDGRWVNNTSLLTCYGVLTLRIRAHSTGVKTRA